MSLIEREALLAEYDRVHVGPPGGARKLIEDALEVPPKVVAEIKIDGDALQRMVDKAVEQMKAELFGNQASTIEPRKGEWVKVYHNGRKTTGHIECSICGWWRSGDWTKHNFCPNCGADMRGEQDG